MEIRKLTKENKGYSLVELIVSVLVSTLVLMSVVAFISVAMNHYRRTGEELNLQVESQIAMNLIHDIVIETQEDVVSTEVDVDGKTYHVIRVLAKRTDKNLTGESIGVLYHHFIVLDNEHHRLLFSKVKVTSPDPYTNVDEDVTKGNMADYIRDNMLGEDNLKRVFLADYATGLAAATADNLVNLTLTFTCGDRTYIAEKAIYIRNYRNI